MNFYCIDKFIERKLVQSVFSFHDVEARSVVRVVPWCKLDYSFEAIRHLLRHEGKLIKFLMLLNVFVVCFLILFLFCTC